MTTYLLEVRNGKQVPSCSLPSRLSPFASSCPDPHGQKEVIGGYTEGATSGSLVAYLNVNYHATKYGHQLNTLVSSWNYLRSMCMFQW